jgi:Protein of unknown function (DUF1778)
MKDTAPAISAMSGQANPEPSPNRDSMESSNAPRSERYRVEIKLSAEEKSLITRGAAAAKLSVSEFVRGAAAKESRRLLEPAKAGPQ